MTFHLPNPMHQVPNDAICRASRARWIRLTDVLATTVAKKPKKPPKVPRKPVKSICETKHTRPSLEKDENA